MIMTPSENAFNLTKLSEGCRLKIYYDNAGNGTIGWGHKILDSEDYTIIDQSTADKLLLADMKIAAGCVNTLVKVILNQNQFDALCDFTFNLGCRDLRVSTLLQLIHLDNYEGAADEFGKWIYSNGKVDDGLVTRREREKELFLKPC